MQLPLRNLAEIPPDVRRKLLPRPVVERLCQHQLVLNAPEGGVNVWVIGPKPIPERGPQETRGGARRSSLQYVVIAVEKIDGITGVERKRLEAGKGLKHGGGPLPAVA